MTKIIPVITSAPIQYSFNNLDIYDAFDLVSQGTLEAPLAPNSLDVIKKHHFTFDPKSIKFIFCAEKGQTLATAKIFVNSGLMPNAEIVTTSLLNGVKFSMKSLISKDQFMNLLIEEALAFARKDFVQELFKNNLSESTKDLILRMNNLISLLKNNLEPTICVSHSFFIKLLEIYVSDKSIFLNESRLIEFFNPKYKPYESLSGFDLVI